MVTFVEKGDFRSPRVCAGDEHGRGKFTVQCTDAPIQVRGKKPRRSSKSQMKARLTPIHEETDSGRCSTCKSDGLKTSTINTGSILLSEEDPTSYLRIGSTHDKQKLGMAKLMRDVADAYEKELANISEELKAYNLDSELEHIICSLPPRPKCKKRVLPPSVTGIEGAQKKQPKLLRRKTRVGMRASSLSPLKDAPHGSLRNLTEINRPKTAEGVCVVHLSDLKSVNSSSVPDLPSIINKFTRVSDVSDFDDSGALSTPRRSNDLGPLKWDDSCLKGKDLASFYNIWDKDRSRRPFDKKYGGKEPDLLLNRSCMCALRQYDLHKCAYVRRHRLPPLQ